MREFAENILKKTVEILENKKIQYNLFDTNINFDDHTYYANYRANLTNLKDGLLIIFTTDFLKVLGSPYCPGSLVTQMLEQLKNIKKPVLWITSVDRAELDFVNKPDNVTFLTYGPDITVDMNNYPTVAPQKEKNLTSDKFFLSLSYAARPNRLLSAFCIAGNSSRLLDNGVLRISNYPITNYQNWQEYCQDNVGEIPNILKNQDSILQNGFLKIKDVCHDGQPDGHTDIRSVGPAYNFDKHLRHLYKNSIVEIVNETIFFTNQIFVTEKFLQSVYGYNLPIVLSTPGAVEFLRQSGFDMFDDVIDHSYDLIKNPLQRIFTAVESNIRLLSDKKYAIDAWNRCLPRLDQNYYYAANHMYNYFHSKFVTDLNNYLKFYFQ